MRIVLINFSPEREPAHRFRTLAGKRQKSCLCFIRDCIVRPSFQAGQANGAQRDLNFDAKTPRGSLVTARSARKRCAAAS
jgi:hypothetical protein